MKLILLKTNLVEALNIVEGSVGSNVNLPILKNVFLGTEDNRIILISTNLELATKHFVAGKIIETGSVTVPFSVLNNIVKNLNTERITLEKRGKNLTILTDNYEASILGQEPNDFPIIPNIQNKKNSIKININAFKEALTNVAVASQYSDLRPEISGVFLNFNNKKLTLVATDSFRLAEIILGPELVQSSFEEVKTIVPLRTVSEILRILNMGEDGTIEIFIDSNQILFKTETDYVISRLVDGNFPDYEVIIPKQTKNEAILAREEVLNAIKLAKVFAGRANDITLSIGDNKKFLEVYSADSMLGENRYRIPVKLKGDKFKVAFNWRYLIDGFKIYKGKEVILGVNEVEKPVLIKSLSEPQSLYIVMPIKS